MDDSGFANDSPLVCSVLWTIGAFAALGSIAWLLAGEPVLAAFHALGASFAWLGTIGVRRGAGRRVVQGVILGGVLLVAAATPFFGGLRGPAPFLWGTLVILAATLLGRREAQGTAGVAAAVLGLHVLFELLGWAPPAPRAPGEMLGTLIAALLVSGRLVSGTLEQLSGALASATEAEARAQQAVREREVEIARRASVEERLQDAVVQARQANKAKSRFLASMSHELRTPLNAIIGYAEILEEEAAPHSDEAADLGRIRQAGKHLLGLINDVLDLSKIEAGRMALEPTDVDVDSLVREVAETVLPAVQARGNRLLLDTPSLGGVFVDGMRLRQVLLNLLSNAAKFTENGEIVLVAMRETVEGVERLRFEVRDTGIGITPEQQSRLFQPFSQADTSTSRKYGGTGLGLVLCQRFAEMMEGRVELDSVLGEGTTVRFVFPTTTAANRVEQLRRRRMAEVDRVRGTSPIVLCVDDEVSALTLLDRMLREEGVHPVPCRDPLQAVEMALQIRPDVITLDLHMPNLDGGELLRQLKEHPELAHVPVVVVSVDGAASATLELGAAAWMRKPIDRSRLLGLIDELGRGSDAPVLVVDDDAPTRDVLVRMLDAGGIATVEATNGREALDLMESVAPRMVLLDLMMPGMDGFQVAETLRADPRWAGLPIVVLTSATLDEQDRERLARCSSVLQKDEETLRNLVHEVKRVA
ncbi:MAG: response regulator [Alphaproteobacteria bacterium]|nr:response regulator [Alphaproteobacteria bacterium]